ncbi:putative ferric-chelate reductase 1 [Brachyhypopomus gauderio]|uniref:putative ferric-chelate reductase 1 n=1 Tax=Brachyhypopomus gauderio TaxID=698409 RepID=UPI00404264BF
MRAYVLLFACVRIVECYGNGQVSSACGSMQPEHGSSVQTSVAPYSISVDRTSYSAGGQITVTLSATSGTFKGFLLEAQSIGGSAPIGYFSSAGTNAQLLTCSGQAGAAVSHSSSTAKTQIQSIWKAPSSGTLNNIQFIATFVQVTKTFWMGVKSAQVSYTSGSGSDSGSATTTNANSTAAKTPSSTAMTSISSTGCGSVKTCVSQPVSCDPSTSTNCYFMSSMPLSDGSGLKFEIFGPSVGYIAIAFSDDKEMGKDDVYICGKNSGGNIQLQHAVTTGTTTPTTIALGNVTNITTSLTNGIISCSFISQNTISTTRSAASTNSYYIFLANGPVDPNGVIQFHPTSPIISSSKVDLFSPQVLGGEQFPAIVKAHGCLMLISWMTTGSIGMLIARYLKRASHGTRCCGKDFWFVAHLFLMLLSVCATIIAFILVFSYAQDWSGGAHPVLGCLVMILSLAQPIAAMFRCSPQHERRFIFNWVHAINALAIKGLAVAAIFTGLILVDSSQDGWLPKVMGGFVAWEALFFLFQDILRKFTEKDVEEDDYRIRPEVFLLFTFFLGNVAFLVTLLVGIGNA